MSPREELVALNTAIATAAMLLAPHRDLLDRYEKERQRMESAGSIFSPTLFNDVERQRTKAVLTPLYNQVRAFLDAYQVATAKSVELQLTLQQERETE